MTNALEVKRALTPRWNKQQVELLKRTVAQGLTDDEFLLFMYTCKRTGLDPFIKQIYAIKRFDSKEDSYRMTIQTGIDGYRLIADRTGKYAGCEKPEFELDPNNPNQPLKATVTVYKMVDGEKCAFVGEARWNEFVQRHPKTKELMGRWADMGFNQLAKCAEAQAHRKAFPADLGSVITHDEAPVIDLTVVEGTAGTPPEKAETHPEALYVGEIVGHTAKNPQKKAPHKLSIKLDTGGEITVGTYELPSVLNNVNFLHRRCQFSYDEKANPRGGEPFRNLKHFALEELKAEPEHQEQKTTKPDDGAAPDSPEGVTQQGSDGPAQSGEQKQAMSFPQLSFRMKGAESVREVSEIMNASLELDLTAEQQQTLMSLKNERLVFFQQSTKKK